jgi:hypothetical protein
MYAIANTTVSILRGTSVDSFGDVIDNPVAVYTGVLAFISAPTMSPLRPIVLGSQVFEPGMPEPSVTRLFACSLPSGTDVTENDQIWDERNSVLYEVYEVTELGVAGATPDLTLTLKRVTTTEQR